MPTNSSHYAHWIAAALFCLIPLTVSVAAEAQVGNATIEVEPESPTTKDEIVIKLSGMWPNRCVPNAVAGIITLGASPSLPRVLNMTIDTFHESDESCGSGLRTWNLDVPIGSRVDGTYRVTVRYRVSFNTAGPVFQTIGTGSFAVEDKTPPTTPEFLALPRCDPPDASQCVVKTHDPITFRFASCDPDTSCVALGGRERSSVRCRTPRSS